MLSAGLAGDAWEEVEHPTADDLRKENAGNNLIIILRDIFKTDARTELAGDSEQFLTS